MGRLMLLYDFCALSVFERFYLFSFRFVSIRFVLFLTIAALYTDSASDSKNTLLQQSKSPRRHGMQGWNACAQQVRMLCISRVDWEALVACSGPSGCHSVACGAVCTV